MVTASQPNHNCLSQATVATPAQGWAGEGQPNSARTKPNPGWLECGGYLDQEDKMTGTGSALCQGAAVLW